MSAWILIGYLAYGNPSQGGGPFTAEFSTEAACRAAVSSIVKDNDLNLASFSTRRAICVPKGEAR